jgi:dihydrofolate reductase
MERAVVSRTMPADRAGVTVIGDDLAARIAELKERPGGDLLLISGPELRTALAGQGLIDRYRNLVAPVALGGGVPLFAPIASPVPLRLVGATAFAGGVVMLDLEPVVARG